jgi:hypothetical protein
LASFYFTFPDDETGVSVLRVVAYPVLRIVILVPIVTEDLNNA